MQERYETLAEVDERLARNSAYGKDDVSAFPSELVADAQLYRDPWYQRSVKWGWFLAVVIFGILCGLFLLGLILHEAGANPPLNGMYEWIHNALGRGTGHPAKYIWRH
jgi:hypothetical protein